MILGVVSVFLLWLCGYLSCLGNQGKKDLIRTLVKKKLFPRLYSRLCVSDSFNWLL